MLLLSVLRLLPLRRYADYAVVAYNVANAVASVVLLATPAMVLMLLLALLSLLRTKIVAATHDQNAHIAEHCAVAMRFLNLSMYSKVHTFDCIPGSPKPVYSNTLHIVQLIALVVPNG